MKQLEFPPRGLNEVLYSYLYRLVRDLNEALSSVEKSCEAARTPTSKSVGYDPDISKKLSTLTESVSNLSNKVSSLESGVKSLQAEIAATNKTVSELRKQYNGISGNIEDINERLEALENK